LEKAKNKEDLLEAWSTIFARTPPIW